MPKNKQEIFQSLLGLHKILLESQKAEYEKTYGAILNTNQYFQLVVSHEDFAWLRQLSALIASFDEILESDSQDISAVSCEIISLLTEGANKDFDLHLKKIIDDNSSLVELVSALVESLKNPA